MKQLLNVIAWNQNSFSSRFVNKLEFEWLSASKYEAFFKRCFAQFLRSMGTEGCFQFFLGIFPPRMSKNGTVDLVFTNFNDSTTMWTLESVND